MTANTNTNATINPATETSTDSARARPLFTYGGTDYYTAEEAAKAGFAQCEECGEWYDFFGVRVAPPAERERKQEKPAYLINWSAGEEL